MYYFGKTNRFVITLPHDLRQHLPADRRHHYRLGRSMAEAARFWMRSPGTMPAGIAAIVGDEPLRAVHFEYDRTVYGGGRSQTDVMVLTSGSVVAIEAKVDEPAGPLVAEWLADPRGDAANRRNALARYAADLGVGEDALMPIRYQFLHRALSAALVARDRGAARAWMVVQMFPGPRGFDAQTGHDLDRFVAAASARPTLARRHVDVALVRCERAPTAPAAYEGDVQARDLRREPRRRADSFAVPSA